MRAGDRPAAIDAYKHTMQKTAGVGLKMDIVFSMLRCAGTCGQQAVAGIALGGMCTGGMQSPRQQGFRIIWHAIHLLGLCYNPGCAVPCRPDPVAAISADHGSL